MMYQGRPYSCCYMPSCTILTKALFPAEVLQALEAGEEIKAAVDDAKATKDKDNINKALLSQKWVKVDEKDATWEVSFHATATRDEKAGALLYVLNAYTTRFLRM